MTVQIIEKNGKPEWAVIPYEEYRRLMADAEMLSDVQAYDEARRDLKAGEDELLPAHVVDSILDGENPIRIWREYRGLSQTKLADLAGISPGYLSQLETGKRTGTADVLVRVAQVLDLSVDDIIFTEE